MKCSRVCCGFHLLSAKLSQWNDSALGSSRYPLEGSLKVRKSLQAGSKSNQEQQDLNPGFNHPLKPLMELFNGARPLCAAVTCAQILGGPEGAVGAWGRAGIASVVLQLLINICLSISIHGSAVRNLDQVGGMVIEMSGCFICSQEGEMSFSRLAWVS